MPRPLKVYGWTSFYPNGFIRRTKNCHKIVAARSMAEAARIAGYERPNQLHNLGETGNARSIEVALANPGVVLFHDSENFVPGESVYRRESDWKQVSDPVPREKWSR